jgi:hypothetical protein
MTRVEFTEMTATHAEVSYSMLSAIGYAVATGHEPRLARATTSRQLRRLVNSPDGLPIARRSRLFKAIAHLQSLGYRVVPEKSTIKEVLMQSLEGVEAIATSRGEVRINNVVEQRFFNG